MLIFIFTKLYSLKLSKYLFVLSIIIYPEVKKIDLILCVKYCTILNNDESVINMCHTPFKNVMYKKGKKGY